MKKIIIGVHGLGNKPTHDILADWWLRSILAGLRKIQYENPFLKFDLVYWADLLHPEPENPDISDESNPLFIEEPFTKERIDPEPVTHSYRKSILKFFEKQMDKLLLNEDLSVNFSGITDMIIRRFFADLDVYYSDQTVEQEGKSILVREAIRNRLYEKLRKYSGYQILLIGHSMGSIIAYDVLCRNADEVEIDSFITIGSPLGIPVIMSKIYAEFFGLKRKKEKLHVPENIKSGWYNFSDLEDKVAMNFDLNDDYDPNSTGVAIRDEQIFNDYASNNERNPHKSYGYLRTEHLAKAVRHFYEKDKSALRLYWEKKFFQVFKFFKSAKIFNR